VAEEKLTWHKIADDIDELEFATNQIAVAEIKGKKICVGKSPKGIFAFAYTCPHAGGILADGYIDPLGNIVCPIHRYKYDLKNGRNVSGEGFYLKHWPLEIRADGIYVGFREPGIFWNLFK
jgi:nitrite reductase/ring-hydroxylating ferredoxin subunit